MQADGVVRAPLRGHGGDVLRQVPFRGRSGASRGRHRTVIVEDVVTSGGQLLSSLAELRDRGAVVEHALCVIDRDGGGREALRSEGVELRSLFSASDLEL